MDFQCLAESILSGIGGVNNVQRFAHCATRLRINVYDYSKVSISRLEEESGVIKVVTSGDQLQIIIGSHVGEVYDIVNSICVDNRVGASHKSDNNPEQTVAFSECISIKKIASVLANIITPLIGPIIAAGLIKAGLAASATFGIISLISWPVAVFYHLHDLLLFFLPLFIAYTASLAFGCSPILMLAIAASLFFVPAGQESAVDFETMMAGSRIYATTLFPVILSILFSSRIEKTLKRFVNQSVSFIIIPLLTLAISIPVSLYILGPLGLWLGKSIAFYYGVIYQGAPVLVCLLIAGVWQISVLAGFHWFFALIMLNTLLLNGNDTALPLLIPAVLGQAGALLGVWLVNRFRRESHFGISAVVSAACGLTEPALYKVNLPLRYPFIIGCVSAAAGGIWFGLYHIKIYSFGILGVISLLQTASPDGMESVIQGLIGSAIAFATALCMTILFMIFRGRGNGRIKIHSK